MNKEMGLDYNGLAAKARRQMPSAELASDCAYLAHYHKQCLDLSRIVRTSAPSSLARFIEHTK